MAEAIGGVAPSRVPYWEAPPAGRPPQASATDALPQQRKHYDQHLSRSEGAGPAPSRDIWPRDMVDQPPRWCVGCRGGHTADIPPDWQPYTPLQRLVNSHLLPGTFQAAARVSSLPVAINPGSKARPLTWDLSKVPPLPSTNSCMGGNPAGPAPPDPATTAAAGQQQGGRGPGASSRRSSRGPGDTSLRHLKPGQLKPLLMMMGEGLREGHEPHRYLAAAAFCQLLDAATGGPTKSHHTVTLPGVTLSPGVTVAPLQRQTSVELAKALVLSRQSSKGAARTLQAAANSSIKGSRRQRPAPLPPGHQLKLGHSFPRGQGPKPQQQQQEEVQTKPTEQHGQPPAGSKQQQQQQQSEPPDLLTALLEALPDVCCVLRRGLASMQPYIVGEVLLVLQRLVASHPEVAPALLPSLNLLLPSLGRWARDTRVRSLPAPGCLPSTGSFIGPQPPAGTPPVCPDCGAPYFEQHSSRGRSTDAAAAAGGRATNWSMSHEPGGDPTEGPAPKTQQQQSRQQQAAAVATSAAAAKQQAAQANPQVGTCGKLPPAKRTASSCGPWAVPPRVHCRVQGSAIAPRRVSLQQLVEETLDMLVAAAGEDHEHATAIIQHSIPVWHQLHGRPRRLMERQQQQQQLGPQQQKQKQTQLGQGGQQEEQEVLYGWGRTTWQQAGQLVRSRSGEWLHTLTQHQQQQQRQQQQAQRQQRQEQQQQCRLQHECVNEQQGLWEEQQEVYQQYQHHHHWLPEHHTELNYQQQQQQQQEQSPSDAWLWDPRIQEQQTPTPHWQQQQQRRQWADEVLEEEQQQEGEWRRAAADDAWLYDPRIMDPQQKQQQQQLLQQPQAGRRPYWQQQGHQQQHQEEEEEEYMAGLQDGAGEGRQQEAWMWDPRVGHLGQQQQEEGQEEEEQEWALRPNHHHHQQQQRQQQQQGEWSGAHAPPHHQEDAWMWDTRVSQPPPHQQHLVRGREDDWLLDSRVGGLYQAGRGAAADEETEEEEEEQQLPWERKQQPAVRREQQGSSSSTQEAWMVHPRVGGDSQQQQQQWEGPSRIGAARGRQQQQQQSWRPQQQQQQQQAVASDDSWMWDPRIQDLQQRQVSGEGSDASDSSTEEERQQQAQAWKRQAYSSPQPPQQAAAAAGSEDERLESRSEQGSEGEGRPGPGPGERSSAEKPRRRMIW